MEELNINVFFHEVEKLVQRFLHKLMTEDIEHSKQQITDEVCSDCNVQFYWSTITTVSTSFRSHNYTHIVGLNMYVRTSAIASLDRFGYTGSSSAIYERGTNAFFVERASMSSLPIGIDVPPKGSKGNELSN